MLYISRLARAIYGHGTKRIANGRQLWHQPDGAIGGVSDSKYIVTKEWLHTNFSTHNLFSKYSMKELWALWAPFRMQRVFVLVPTLSVFAIGGIMGLRNRRLEPLEEYVDREVYFQNRDIFQKGPEVEPEKFNKMLAARRAKKWEYIDRLPESTFAEFNMETE